MGGCLGMKTCTRTEGKSLFDRIGDSLAQDVLTENYTTEELMEELRLTQNALKTCSEHACKVVYENKPGQRFCPLCTEKETVKSFAAKALQACTDIRGAMETGDPQMVVDHLAAVESWLRDTIKMLDGVA